MIKNIIFDWSGVISDDFTQGYEAAMYIFDHLGVSSMSRDEFRAAFFLPYMEFYKKYIPTTSREEIDPLFKEALAIVPGPSVYPGAKKVLESLHAKEIRMVVLSTHPNEEIIKEAQDYGVNDLLINIHGSVQDKREEIVKALD